MRTHTHAHTHTCTHTHTHTHTRAKTPASEWDDFMAVAFPFSRCLLTLAEHNRIRASSRPQLGQSRLLWLLPPHISNTLTHTYTQAYTSSLHRNPVSQTS